VDGSSTIDPGSDGRTDRTGRAERSGRAGSDPPGLGGDDRPGESALGKAIFWGMAARSLLLEASWNHQGQQSLGFLATIDPALAAIHAGDPEGLTGARLKALTFFNTNPVSSALVIGAALKLEEQAKRGSITEPRRAAIQAALASALAAQGDRLFWQSWLPLCCLAACVATCATGRPWAVLAAPILYGLLIWPVRLAGLRLGYREGQNVYTVIQRFRVNLMVGLVSGLAMILLAVWTTLALRSALAHHQGPPWRVAAAAAGVFAVVRLLRLGTFRRRSLAAWLLYPAALAAMLALSALL
jgi:mannose/fructose/N-acetylgalactosamine-specific phosphotransferase system component IID